MPYIIFFSVFFLFSCGNSSDQTNTNSSASKTQNDTKRIIYFGDSLTAGYGLLDYEDAWPHVLTKRINAEGYAYQMTNAGVSGDTTSGGLGRLEWVLAEKPTIFVLELGANDMLRGISPNVTKENLRSMIRQIKSQYPNTTILLVGMYATPNMGKKYASAFNSIYPELSKEEDVPLVPFILEKVASIRKLNQKDGIHPTEAGHKLVSETVYPYLKPLLVK
ncbi:arylesterase [Leptospira sp. 2 VSF19]|uniref:Arylesterase n=1 Tax=Leptospira soteropolitanensis TaxID=2950025 RepID=A0AAW5VJC4_9LEPT|nr:arylesterase [Leptospira soteropolitanensis]MCW7493914.1 arylesterase [Leptospira soteropolitanensis]MCW7501508.1 arylesterase [Leptospira soteropolitanensis]MCW7523730.1 arylesterase [Leptospira soteropolitanensis]MCW7527593.1 arylesterase [Leptospira soteropolitanensis]MCW7531447.1 arylesterase [Leptospira soteropolitanensis]